MPKIFERGNAKVMRVNWNDLVSNKQLDKFKGNGGIGVVSSSRENKLDKKHLKKIGLKYRAPKPFASHSVAELCAYFVLLSSRVCWTKSNGLGHQITFYEGREVKDKIALVIGASGAIGRAVSSVLKGLGLTVFGWDVADYTSREGLLFKWLHHADFVVVCIPLEGNQDFFSIKHLDAMWNKPVLINLSRKGLFSFELIYEALEEGYIRYYMVDDVLDRGLCENNRVFCTEHVGSHTVEARGRQERYVEESVNLLFKKNS